MRLWTQDEVTELKAMKEAGKSIAEIAAHFGRNNKQVLNKLFRLKREAAGVPVKPKREKAPGVFALDSLLARIERLERQLGVKKAPAHEDLHRIMKQLTAGQCISMKNYRGLVAAAYSYGKKRGWTVKTVTSNNTVFIMRAK